MFAKEGWGVATFFLVEFQVFSLIAGRAFMESKNVYLHRTRRGAYYAGSNDSDRFILMDMITEYLKDSSI